MPRLLSPASSLGITFNIWNHDITQSSRFKKEELTTGKRMFRGTEFDVNFLEINELEIDEGYSFVFGGSYRVNEHWNIGMVIKPKFDLDIDHEITMGNSPEIRGAELDMPMIVGAGVAWRANDS